MIFHKTKIKDLYILEVEPIKDNRGYFAKVFSEKIFRENGLNYKVNEINKSFNLKKGTLRGLHFQKRPMAESKIVRCVKGKIFDVIIDLRPESKTYKKWFSIELNSRSNKMLLIPKDFAHGFQTLTDKCEVVYFMHGFYSPKHASGIRWNDLVFKIKWPLKVRSISGKDKNWPNFKI